MKLENWQSNFLSCCQKIQTYYNTTLLLEKKLKLLECTANHLDNSEYVFCKSKLDQFYEEKTYGIRIRNKCNWYKCGEKSAKFFLNPEKNSSTPK